MGNFINDFLDDTTKFFDKAYNEGWLYYALGIIILVVLLVFIS